MGRNSEVSDPCNYAGQSRLSDERLRTTARGPQERRGRLSIATLKFSARSGLWPDIVRATRIMSATGKLLG